jgi:hypothetical protein
MAALTLRAIKVQAIWKIPFQKDGSQLQVMAFLGHDLLRGKLPCSAQRAGQRAMHWLA